MNERHAIQDLVPAAVPPLLHHEIPTFYKRTYPSKINTLIEREVYLKKIQQWELEIITREDTFHLARQLKSYGDSEGKIGYKSFKLAKEVARERTKPLFSALNFMTLADESGKVEISQFHEFVVKWATIMEKRGELAKFDSTCTGILLQEDLDRYFSHVFSTNPNIKILGENMEPFYVCHATRKVLFILDTANRGKVNVQSLLESSLFEELCRIESSYISKKEAAQNWFSQASASHIYKLYTSLDLDKNGMLSLKELQKYREHLFTKGILARIFEECETYDGELDYQGFIDFILAIENMGSTSGIAYWFKLLDLEQKGFLSERVVTRLYEDVVKEMQEFGYSPPSSHNIVNELFDMCRVQGDRRIFPQDLVRCGNGGVVLSILTEVNGLWKYEHAMNA